MKKIIAPTHVENYCNDVEGDIYFKKLKQEYAGDYSYLYKIICNCKNDKFIIYKDSHPSLYAECCLCKKRITIYDLSEYPAAIKLDKAYDLNRIADFQYELYVNYEYSDEYLYEDDVVFDNNDITWVRAFVRTDAGIIKILDDETC